MARLVVSSNFTLRMDRLSVSAVWSGPTPIAELHLVQRENSSLVVTEYRGSFLYDLATDELVGGHLWRIDQFYDERPAFTITGLDVDMGAFLDWADYNDTDLALASMFAGDDDLIGGRGADYLEGFGGADILNGRQGRDTMVGGTGDDTYYVDNARDLVVEHLGEGNDRIYTSVSYRLSANSSIEILSASKASSKTAINLTGNSDSNILLGNAGRNVLRGGAGDDDLDGGAGNDVLVGGAGADAFCFSTRLSSSRNFDRIKNFTPDWDLIELDQSVFSMLPLGELWGGFFRVGARAKDADDHIIYNPRTGVISYDADGVGGQRAIKFAQVTAGLALDSSDFFVV